MWSSSVTTGAELSISGISAKDLAREFGTPILIAFSISVIDLLFP